MTLLPKRHFKHIAVLAMAAILPALHAHGADSTPEAVGFSCNEISSNLVLIAYEVDGQKKSGNGVVVQMQGKPYLLTSLQTILGAEKISFITASGERLAPRRVELSSNRDLARLALKEDDQGLPFSTKAKMNTPIAVFTGGNGKEQRLEHGKIIGVGGGKIEISAEFDDSNSGAPALNARKEVVGIASYSRTFSHHAMKTGTRFDKTTRHFCYRVGKGSWIPVNWKTYDRKYGKKYRKHNAFCSQIIDILKNSENFNDSRKRAGELVSGCRTHARQLRLLSEQRDLTDFLLNDFEEKAELLEYAGKLFADYANSKR